MSLFCAYNTEHVIDYPVLYAQKLGLSWVRCTTESRENWETNVAGKIGLGVAIDYACGWGLEAIWARVRALAARLRSQLRELAGVTIHDQGQTQCGIVSFTVAGQSASGCAIGSARNRSM
jgi:hypothetical protein